MFKQAFISFNKEDNFQLRDINSILGDELTRYSIITTSLKRDKHIVNWCKENELSCTIINLDYEYDRQFVKNIAEELSLIIIDYKLTVDVKALYFLGNSYIHGEEELKIFILSDTNNGEDSSLFEIVCGIRWLQIEIGFDKIENMLNQSKFTIIDTKGLEEENSVVLTELNKCHIEVICGLSEIYKISLLEMAEGVV